MLEATASIAPSGNPQGKMIFGREVMPWTERELAFLRSVAAGRVTREVLKAGLPDRSYRASSKQLSKVRRAMDIEPKQVAAPNSEQHNTRLSPDDSGQSDGEETRWRSRAAKSNVLFLEALHRSLAA